MATERSTDHCLDELVAARWLDGGLDGRELQQWQPHLDRCPACRRLIAAVSELVALPARGRYELRRSLGEGGFGCVFEAWDRELQRAVAIKLLDRVDASAAAELRREARALARLNDAHVISIFDVGELDGHMFIAMELMCGGTLRQWLSAGRDAAEVLRRFVAAGQGLVAAHEAGLVQGDFKADNVLLGSDGRVVVSDFGLARAAPDEHADQHAFGVELRRALGARGTAAVNRAIRRMCQPDPRRRFPTMRAALAALTRPRRRLWPLGIGAVVLVAAASAFAGEGTEAVACRDSPPLYAASSVTDDRTRSAVVRFAEVWHEQHAAVCAHDGERRRAGLHCLARGKAALDAQLDLLPHLDAKGLDRVPAVFAELVADLDCSAGRADPVAPPNDAWARALARAQARMRFGTFEGVDDTLGDLLAEAEGAGAAGAAGRVHLLLGASASAGGAPAEAHDQFVAAALKGESVGADALVVQGWSRALQAAIRRGDTAAAKHAFRAAQAYADRSTPLRARLRAEIAAGRGRLAQAEGRYPDAIDAFTDALKHAESGWQQAHLERELAAALSVAGDFDGAQEHAQLALSLFDAAGAGANDRAPVFDSLARIASQRGDHEAAERWATRLLDALASVGLDHGVNFAVGLGVRGTNRLHAGQLDAARADLERALSLFESTVGHDSPTAANGWYSLGMLELEAGRPVLALEQLDTALALAERGENKHFIGAIMLGRCAAQRETDDAAAGTTCTDAARRLGALLPADHPHVVEARSLAAIGPRSAEQGPTGQ